ncbi:uncharacterized protein BDV17DRAFT_276656 [Aspergillus undulatus]|uniref:uncharacterized protein n=1 Tax=Aspergillus undulatus TaxID=1810928 RepID=UPI003CCDB4B4
MRRLNSVVLHNMDAVTVGKLPVTNTQPHDEISRRRFPLLECAVENVFYHANAAASATPQDDFL